MKNKSNLWRIGFIALFIISVIVLTACDNGAGDNSGVGGGTYWIDNGNTDNTNNDTLDSSFFEPIDAYGNVVNAASAVAYRVVRGSVSPPSIVINIPAEYNDKPVIAIGRSTDGQLGQIGVFDGNWFITTVNIPATVKEIYSAFVGCRNLTSVNFAANSQLQIIGWHTFGYTDRLISITIPDSVTTIGDWAFVSSGLTNIIFSPSSQLQIIGPYAFYGCESLTSITIPNNVTTIGEVAFRRSNLTGSITIPPSVTSIGDGAFFLCENLTSINVDTSNPNFSSEDGVLFNKTKTSLLAYPAGKTGAYTIPSSVTHIASSFSHGGAFRYTSITSIIIPSSVTFIGFFPFAGCSNLTSINVDTGNPNFSSEDGVLFNKTKTSLLAYPAGRTGAYTIPLSVTYIDACAFWFATNLTSIIIPSSVNIIEFQAFTGCTSLTSITIPASVIYIGSGAFEICTNLISVTFQGIIGDNIDQLPVFDGDLDDKRRVGGIGTYTRVMGSYSWNKL
jgi:hypothetical protein